MAAGAPAVLRLLFAAAKGGFFILRLVLRSAGPRGPLSLDVWAPCGHLAPLIPSSLPRTQFVNRALWVKNFPDRPITHRLRGFLQFYKGRGPTSAMFGLSQDDGEDIEARARKILKRCVPDRGKRKACRAVSEALTASAVCPFPCPTALSSFAFIFLTEKIGESLTILRRLYGLQTQDLLFLLPKVVSQSFVIGKQPTPTVCQARGSTGDWHGDKPALGRPSFPAWLLTHHLCRRRIGFIFMQMDRPEDIGINFKYMPKVYERLKVDIALYNAAVERFNKIKDSVFDSKWVQRCMGPSDFKGGQLTKSDRLGSHLGLARHQVQLGGQHV